MHERPHSEPAMWAQQKAQLPRLIAIPFGMASDVSSEHPTVSVFGLLKNKNETEEE